MLYYLIFFYVLNNIAKFNYYFYNHIYLSDTFGSNWGHTNVYNFKTWTEDSHYFLVIMRSE